MQIYTLPLRDWAVKRSVVLQAGSFFGFGFRQMEDLQLKLRFSFFFFFPQIVTRFFSECFLVPKTVEIFLSLF